MLNKDFFLERTNNKSSKTTKQYVKKSFLKLFIPAKDFKLTSLITSLKCKHLNSINFEISWVSVPEVLKNKYSSLQVAMHWG